MMSYTKEKPESNVTAVLNAEEFRELSFFKGIFSQHLNFVLMVNLFIIFFLNLIVTFIIRNN